MRLLTPPSERPCGALASYALALAPTRPTTSTLTSRRGCAGRRTIGSWTLVELMPLRMNGSRWPGPLRTGSAMNDTEGALQASGPRTPEGLERSGRAKERSALFAATRSKAPAVPGLSRSKTQKSAGSVKQVQTKDAGPRLRRPGKHLCNQRGVRIRAPEGDVSDDGRFCRVRAGDDC
jgi:hypothetical protein